MAVSNLPTASDGTIAASGSPRSTNWPGRNFSTIKAFAARAAATSAPWLTCWRYPLLAHNTTGTLAAARALHNRAARPNLFIKIPGTSEGLPAIEEAIFAGIPVNVTLLFSGKQYVAAAEAYMRGIERRIGAGLNPDVGSVASLFVSRWDVAVAQKVP